jgi:hypothetical protein
MKAAYSTRKSLSLEDVSVIIINYIPSLGITKNFKKNQSNNKNNKNSQTRKGSYIIEFRITFE